MKIETLGEENKPVIIFFHAMGVTGASSIPIAQYLKNDYFIIMPTNSAYCENETYTNKSDELYQLNQFLRMHNVREIELVVASSLGAILGMEFITKTKITVKHVFFDGGQFAQISLLKRRILEPILYLCIKSFFWTKGKTIGKVLWCKDESIFTYFIEAGKFLDYKSIHNMMNDHLTDDEFPFINEEMQKNVFWEFGSIEEHLKYREALMKRYQYGNFPVFEGKNHMELQIREPKGFSEILRFVIKNNRMPN